MAACEDEESGAGVRDASASTSTSFAAAGSSLGSSELPAVVCAAQDMADPHKLIELSPGYCMIRVEDDTDPHLPRVRELLSQFRAMLGKLGVEIGEFQAFEEELKTLPGKYSAEHGGELFVVVPAVDSKVEAQVALGCIAFRRHDATTAEMKRMYVDPRSRGRGLGKLLGEFIV